MKFLKGITVLLGLTVTVVSAIQSLEIANIGVTNQIPQLEGDAGGGMLFVILCLFATLFSWLKPIISIPLFVLATLASLLTGLIYDDPIMYAWSIAPLLFAISCFFILRRDKHKSTRSQRKTKAILRS